MTTVVVGIGDCQIATEPDVSLVTYALGSCVGITIYDPVTHVGGLLHFMLPESSLDLAKAERTPHVFADTGIPLLFRTAYQVGAEKKRLVVTVAGGAQMMDSTFNIGKRNILAMKKILWKAGVLVAAEHLGGVVSRTIRLDVKTGNVMLREAGGPEEQLVAKSSGIRKAL